MLGAIAGDIAGSPWEGGQHNLTQKTLFNEDCVFTDDTVCTVAVADALLNNIQVSTALRKWVRRFPNRGYGGHFIDWAHNDDAPAYNSFGNGGAMRAAAVGWLTPALEVCWDTAHYTACCTHSHPEGIAGARAIAIAVWLGRQGLRGEQLRRELGYYIPYDLTPSVFDLKCGDGASTRALDSVPIALISAIESNNWFEAVRNAISIGGDTDTTACMAGGIAEACHGLPREYALKTLAYLPPEMQYIVQLFYQRIERPAPWQTPSFPAQIQLWLKAWKRAMRN